MKKSALQITFSQHYFSSCGAFGNGRLLSDGFDVEVFTSWRAVYRAAEARGIHRGDLNFQSDYGSGLGARAAEPRSGNLDRRSGAWRARFIMVDGSNGRQVVVGNRTRERVSS